VPASALDRRAAVAVLGAAALALAVLGWWLVPWDWVPGGALVPARVEELLTPAQLDRAEAYADVVRPLSWASYAVSLAVGLLLGLTPLGARALRRLPRWLPRWLPRRWRGRLPWWATVVVGVLLVELVLRLVTLPFALRIRAENLAVGLTHQSLGGWVADRALGLLVGWVTLSLLVLLVVGTARRRPRTWFAWAGAVVVALTFVVSFLYPVVVEPLFNRFTPMPDGPLRASILQLAKREQVPVDDVLVADASRRTTTLNAYVSGLGGTRRIVVYDNLVDDAPPAQVRAVVAHELAHAKHHDVLVGTTLAAVAAAGGVAALALLLDWPWLLRRAAVSGPADPAAVALVLALVATGSALATPVQNTASRAIEARADRTSLEVTGDAAAFVALQRSLAVRSLADPTPPRWAHVWFGSHPTLPQRAGLPASLERADR
jgi:STE24 endopeptidase